MAGLFADEGITGTSAQKRPEFLRMICQCRQKKIDLILTKSVSRFARNTVDSLKYVRILKELGIAVFFEEQNINTLDADNEMLLTIHRARPLFSTTGYTATGAGITINRRSSPSRPRWSDGFISST